MGFYVEGNGSIFIKASDLPQAKALLQNGEFTNSSDQKMTVQEYLSWAKPEIDFDNLDDILRYCGVDLSYDEQGNVDFVFYRSENYHSDDVMVLALLAPLMRPGDHLDLASENDSFWRWTFDKDAPDGCIYEDGIVVYPSDGVGRVVNEEGKDAAWNPSQKESGVPSIQIETPAGTLLARVCRDPDYPGIDVILVDKDGVEINLALIEHVPGGEGVSGAEHVVGDNIPAARRQPSTTFPGDVLTPGLMARVWNDGEREDPISIAYVNLKEDAEEK